MKKETLCSLTLLYSVKCFYSVVVLWVSHTLLLSKKQNIGLHFRLASLKIEQAHYFSKPKYLKSSRYVLLSYFQNLGKRIIDWIRCLFFRRKNRTKRRSNWYQEKTNRRTWNSKTHSVRKDTATLAQQLEDIKSWGN